MTGFKILKTEKIKLRCPARLANMYVLSPFVWVGADGFEVMLRAVPRRDDEPRLKMAEVWHGRGDDGLSFEMDPGPCLFPGPDIEDLDGCEDPTVLRHGSSLHAWYTGWNQRQEKGRLLHASGPDARRLKKRGVALSSSARFGNPKEATMARAADRDWRLFFEYASGGASRIGMAKAAQLDGPWTPKASPLKRRAGQWDEWHMSSGPVIGEGGAAPVMFYNGATQDAHWRIGWAVFDGDFDKVIDRSDEPLITPGARDDAATDIAFAASALERGDRVWLYYSLSDQEILRATLIRTA